jgi:hypothetical protein
MKTLAHVYDTYNQARAVVIGLEDAGIPSSDITLVANKAACEEVMEAQSASGVPEGAGFGAAIGGAAGLLAGLGVLAIPGLGAVVAAGALAATAVGAVAGATTGGMVGALVKAGVPEEEAQLHCDGVQRGGAMVSARFSQEHEARVRAIMLPRG